MLTSEMPVLTWMTSPARVEKLAKTPMSPFPASSAMFWRTWSPTQPPSEAMGLSNRATKCTVYSFQPVLRWWE